MVVTRMQALRARCEDLEDRLNEKRNWMKVLRVELDKKDECKLLNYDLVDLFSKVSIHP